MNLLPIVERGDQTLADGDSATPSLGVQSAALFGGLHGTYVEHGLKGLVFSSTSNPNALAFQSVASSAGLPPLSLYNPASSRKYVSVISWEIAISLAATTPVIGAYIFLVTTQQFTAVPANSTVAMSIISKGRSYSAQPAQVAPGVVGTFYRPFVNHLTGSTSTLPNDSASLMIFDGTCILSPNTGIWLAQLNVDGLNAIPESKVIWEEFK